ncbi:MAG: glycosyltransferase family 2 protein [Anderseniella sp.]
MRIAILVCTSNQPGNMVQTLTSIANLAIPASSSCTFTIVNNSVKRVTLRDFEIHAKALPTTIVNEPSPGLSIARNTGIASIDADYVIFTDDDVTVPRNWLAAYEAAFRRYPDAAFFGSDIAPLFLEADSSWGHAFSTAAGSCFARFQVGPRDRKIDVMTRPSFYPFGANMAFRVDALRQFRFDEKLGRQPDGLVLSGEETKLISDMVAAGHDGYLISDNPVNHRIMPSRQTLTYVAQYYYGQGWQQASDVRKSGKWTGLPDKVLSPVAACLFRWARPVASVLKAKTLRVWFERQHGHFSGRTAALRKDPIT